MDAYTFIEKHGKPAAEALAHKAGTKYVYFYQIACGHRKPSPALAKALVEASGGELTLTELRPDIYDAIAQ